MDNIRRTYLFVHIVIHDFIEYLTRFITKLLQFVLTKLVQNDTIGNSTAPI